MSGKINTVLGDASPAELGFVLPHEYLTSNFEPFYRKPGKKLKNFIPESDFTLENISYVRQYPYSSRYNLKLDDKDAMDAVLAELRTFKEFGGGTVVDKTCTGINRNVNTLRWLSETSGLHLVAGTGYYLEDTQADDTVNFTVEELTNVMTKELTYNCYENDAVQNIRAGFIGEIASLWPLRAFERRVIQAAGESQSQVGCGVIFSPATSEAVHEIMRIYQEAGGAAEKVVMSHLDRIFTKKEDLLDFSKLGTYCQFDSFGVEISYNQRDVEFDMPTDADRIDMVQGLLAEGKQDRILISHGIHSKHRLTNYGGTGYSHILNNVIRKMKERGITKEVIDKITIDNPSLWLMIPTP